MVKVPHLSSAHSLKANLLHSPSNLPALFPLTPLPRLRLAKDLQLSNGHQVRELLKARDLPLARALPRKAREGHLNLKGNSLSPSSRNRLQARSLQQASSRGPPSPLGSSHWEGHRGLVSRVALEHLPPSSLDLLLKAKGAQVDAPHCSKSLSPLRSPVRTTRLWAAPHN